MDLPLQTVTVTLYADFRTTKLSVGGAPTASTNVANEIEASVMAALSAGLAPLQTDLPPIPLLMFKSFPLFIQEIL